MRAWLWSLLMLVACSTPGTSSTPELPACSQVAFSAPGSGLVPDAFTQALNQVRATPCRCAGQDFPQPAPPVRWNAQLAQAALAHSQDMQQHNFFSHTGSDGSNPGQRIQRTGYRAASWGENIAAGQPDMPSVIRAWLSSQTGHCQAIKSQSFSEIGAAVVEGNSVNTYRTYWTLVLARPH
ncbi:CAP domain-containing protein [Meiothermus sp. QL-1]|uniref:CAP domain-containing protein n=1 Tax=Meiothermus sp. QL-1 TaxID=2058095 RepID=UPI000E0A97D4|nr:CAP domain-containing protein [Meiothermus sp. QL-1]RDI95753.1 CAP domain-containing protein [Meiothermus sp. QL-1]